MGTKSKTRRKTRMGCNALLQNVEAASRQFIATGDHCRLTWAPQRPDNVARLARTIRTFYKAAPASSETRLQTLLAFEPMVGLTDPELLLDLWKHPLLDSKDGDIIQQAQAPGQPAQVIVAQSGGPAVQ